jgi:hypothetical protein
MQGKFASDAEAVVAKGKGRGSTLGGLARFSAFGLAAVVLAGCATPYQDLGLRGGVRAVQITSDIAQVTARGSAMTDSDRIEQYVLRKAAETTLAAGYDHFEVVSASDRTRTIQGVAGYAATTQTGFPSAGLSLPFIRPGETVLIRMSRGTASGAAGATLFDAREVVAHLGEPARRRG